MCALAFLFIIFAKNNKMYRINDIVTSFKSLVGWEQDRVKVYQIEEDLTTSNSGIYFQEAHPLLTLRAMQGIMPEDWGEQYPTYYSDITYSKGDIVKSGGKNYKSLVDGNIGHSVVAPDYWASYNPLSAYLEDMVKNGIKKVVQRFVRDKVIGMETRNLLDRKTLFDGAGRLEARTKPTGKLVGFEIIPLRTGGATMKIEKIGLQFVGNVGQITMYLFHSSKAEPIATKTFNYDSTYGTYKWFDVAEMFLPYYNEFGNGGSWYLVYNQNALPAYMESVNFGRDWSREPCGTCNKGDVQLYREMGKYVQVSPFCVDATNWNGRLWDIAYNMYTPSDNYGINIQFSIGCDLTDFMLSQRLMFANVLQLQVASIALKTLALNPEVVVNRVQVNADRNKILFETEGDGQGIKGLNNELEKAYKALSFDTKGIDPICLTCHNKGIRIGAI